MSKKILLLLGNPDSNTYSGRVADTYEQSAHEAGFEVNRVNIGDLHFDPILHMGYKVIQDLEPDLHMMQEKFRWADHIVIVYPNWWNAMPGILKGLFDRMWLPGFAFNFDKQTKKLTRHLTGKTARIIVVSGTQGAFMTWWKYGDFTNELAHGILGFAGISSKVTAFGPSDKCTDADREKWLKKIASLGKRGA